MLDVTHLQLSLVVVVDVLVVIASYKRSIPQEECSICFDFCATVSPHCFIFLSVIMITIYFCRMRPFFFHVHIHVHNTYYVFVSRTLLCVCIKNIIMCLYQEHVVRQAFLPILNPYPYVLKFTLSRALLLTMPLIGYARRITFIYYVGTYFLL